VDDVLALEVEVVGEEHLHDRLNPRPNLGDVDPSRITLKRKNVRNDWGVA